MVVIFCPRGNATGGTELLHQLGYKLNLLGYDAFMYYYGDEDDQPKVHPHFKKYSVPVKEVLEDASENVFVYPEEATSSLKSIMAQLPLSKHVLWWLSVDNAHMTPELEKQISTDDKITHMVQSYYADDYVGTVLGIPNDRRFYLSDYLNNAYLNSESCQKREDVVLFNPRKGFDRTANLIKNSDYRIKWRAIAGLAPEDIPGILQTAKVYIDFGNHPGKDRFPREAVSCGCRILTGRKGAASNPKDIPIPDQLKIDDDADDRAILALVYSLIENYDKTSDIYEDYRRMINEEFHTFEIDTLKVFSRISERVIEREDLDKSELRDTIMEEVSAEEYIKAFSDIVLYRLKGYDIDKDFMILEGYTRLGIGEEQVAIYLMNEILRKYTDDYEAYLIKARALIAINKPGAKEALENALMYSTGTDDEQYVAEAVRMLRNDGVDCK